MNEVFSSPIKPIVLETEKIPVVALTGNPNSGKTTLFNGLTGLRQKVGNYPGVTVEKKTGECRTLHGQLVQLLDLPGIYSLSARSPDEVVSRDVLLGDQAGMARPDAVICVVDASNLERNLYLCLQVLDLGVPVIIALNMMDLAEARGMRPDAEALSRALGVPVIACQANAKKGLTSLKQALAQVQPVVAPRAWRAPEEMEAALDRLTALFEGAGLPQAAAHALLWLGDPVIRTQSFFAHVEPAVRQKAGEELDLLEKAGLASPSETIISARYDAIGRIAAKTVRREEAHTLTFTDKLDAWLVHPVFGWAFFLGIMALMFYSIFTWASIPADWIEEKLSALGGLVEGVMPEGDLRSLIVEGVIAGLAGVLVFVPQIAILFLFIGLLESSGYMARAAFIMDRFMSRVGLNGKAFIPLLSSYACAIPGIMATRTIENPKDRLITILVAPWMSCSARLPVYTVLLAAMFSAEVGPLKLATMMLGLYLLGTIGAFAAAWFFKKTLARGEKSLFLMELPPYRVPVPHVILRGVLERVGLFVRRAGTVILALSVLLWALAYYPRSGSENKSAQLEQSYMGRIGHVIEPAVRPLGYDWKIGIGVLASFAAREVFNSNMKIVYGLEEDAEDETFVETMRGAVHPDGTKVFTTATCASLLVFFVFAMQCLSTVAVVRRETNGWKWPIFQIVYQTGTAYVLALLTYQIGTHFFK